MTEQINAVSTQAEAINPETINPEDINWMGLFKGRLAIYSMTFGGSVALHAVNIFIATTIMPSVVRDIGGLDVYAWSSTAFVIISILSAALASRLLALAGAGKAYIVAALIFIVGTLLCALAPNIWILILGRALQGLGGGFFYALAYAVIRMVYPSRLWPIAIGFITVMWGIATLIGPAIGGIFAELGSWRAAFWVLIPFTVLFGAVAYVVLPKREGNNTPVEGLPTAQIVLLVAIVLAVSIGSMGATLLKTVVSLAVAALLGGLLVRVEARAKERLLPKGALSVRNKLGAHYLCIGLLLIGMQPEIFVPYILQVLHAQPPLWAGYIGALMALGWTAGSMVSASWTGSRAAKSVLLGPFFCLLGLLLQACFLPIFSQGEWSILAPICVGLILVGFGIGMAWPHIVTRIYQRAPAAEYDLAAGAVTTVQLFATALGAAVGGMVVNLAGINDPGGVAGATDAALWLCLLFAIAPFVGLFVARKATHQSKIAN
jgi:MFS family permease